MIPYVAVRAFNLFGLRIAPFRWLLAAAVLVGFLTAVRHARNYGIGREKLAEMSVWMTLGGIVGSIAFKIVYHPGVIAAAFHSPRLAFRYFGISSFGGLFGGCVALLLYFLLHRAEWPKRLAILDSLGFAMPFAWAIGRMGCALAHDHPGMRSDSLLAVAFPRGSRFDLGVLEVLFHLGLAACFLGLSRTRRPAGFYFAAFFCAYGPFRFLLDYLHVNPPRYFGVTVDSYAAILATLLGLLTLAAMVRQQPSTLKTGKPSCRHAFSPL